MKKRCLNILENRNSLTGKTGKPAKGKERTMLRRSLTISAVTLLLILLASCAYAIPPRHNASAITAGTFNSGNYTFPDSLNITSFLEAASIFFVNPITQKVGIGIANPDTTLHVNGDVKIEGALNTTGDVFLPTRSLSSCSGKLITDADGNITCAPDESYNSTYDTWAYNQTTPAIAYSDAQGFLTGIDWLNVLFINDSVLNSTYLLVGENETSIFIPNNVVFDNETLLNSTYVRLDDINNSYLLKGENETSVFVPDNVVFSNESLLNDTYLLKGENLTVDDWTNVAFINDSVFNNTYLTSTDWTNVLFVNETTLNDTYALNSSLSTYDTWAYNMTAPAIAYSDANFITSTGLNASYLLKGENETSAQGGMDYTNVAMTNQSNTFMTGQVIDNTSAVTDAYLNISDGNSPKLIVDSAGNVGIGTASPSFKLDVYGDTNTTGLLINATNCDSLDTNAEGLIVCGTDATGGGMDYSNIVMTNQSNSFAAGYNQTFDSGTLFIDAESDRVGIGTTGPEYKLSIDSSADPSNIALNIVNNVSYPQLIRMYIDGQRSGGFGLEHVGGIYGLDFYYNNAVQAQLQSNGGWAIGSTYATTANLINPANGMIVQGNVGIGTTRPGVKLDIGGFTNTNSVTDLGVKGTAKFNEATYFDSSIFTSGTTYVYGTSSRILVYGTNAYIQMYDDRKLGFGGFTGGAYDTVMGYNSVDDTFRIAKGTDLTTTPRIVLDTNGNVGIGTSSPNSTLVVAGVIQALPVASAVCNANAEGGIYYDSGNKTFYGCNSTDWLPLS